jgi:hypothetical protein
MSEDSAIAISEACIHPGDNGKACGAPAVSADMPYCYFHMKEVGDNGKVVRYFDLLPSELRADFEQHLQGTNQKDLSGELAMFRTIMSFIVKKMDKDRDENGNVVLNRSTVEQIREFGLLIKNTVEAQAKVNPDKVISLADMKKIVMDILQIIGNSVPAGDMRDQLIKDIQKYCLADLLNRAIELPPGGSMPKQKL